MRTAPTAEDRRSTRSTYGWYEGPLRVVVGALAAREQRLRCSHEPTAADVAARAAQEVEQLRGMITATVTP